jgi:hypothetical protein
MSGQKRSLHTIYHSNDMNDHIKEPAKLWNEFKKQGGFEIKLRSGARGRDAALAEKVLHDLTVIAGASSGKYSTVEDLLAADRRSTPHRVTTESLLVALLGAQKDFSIMMREILDMLRTAAAKKDRETFSVEFNFGKSKEPVSVQLREFAQQVERVEEIHVSILQLPEIHDIWRLIDTLGKWVVIPDIKLPARDIVLPPTPPMSGIPRIDKLLLDLNSLTHTFCSWCLQYSSHRGTLYGLVHNLPLPPDAGPNRASAILQADAARDSLDIHLLRTIKAIALYAKENGPYVDEVEQAVESFLATTTRRNETLKRRVTDYLNILNLPIWKKRHELYSVWLGTVLLQNAAKHSQRIEYHPANGTLSFGFGGNKLATYVLDGKSFEIHSELRTPLVGKSRKRKIQIQPDFRVLEAGTASQNDATRLVLESKHYLKPGKTNFVDAAEDYARSCDKAEVLVVNHGPSPVLNTPDIDAGLQERIQFLGNVIADGNKTQLADAIKTALFPAPPVSKPVGPSPAQPCQQVNLPGTVTLQWDDSLGDMDLSIEALDVNGAMRAQIYYARKGHDTAEPYVQLLGDCFHGPGQETIEIHRWLYSYYRVIVTNYDQRGAMTTGALSCTIELPNGSTVIAFPANGSKLEPWHVVTIANQNGEFILIPSASGHRLVQSSA